MIAIYKNGVLIPKETINLKENEEIEIYIPSLEYQNHLEKLRELMKENDPLEGKTEEEIIELIRKQRDDWWDKEYAHKFGY